MPRKSPFAIVLSKEERIALEVQARQYTSPYYDVVRAKIVLLAAENLSNDIIVARLDTPRQMVSKWRKRFALARLPGLESQPRGGRPARFAPSVVVDRRAVHGPTWSWCTPVPVSWLNQIEIYFSIVQSKVLTPNDRKQTVSFRRLRPFQIRHRNSEREHLA